MARKQQVNANLDLETLDILKTIAKHRTEGNLSKLVREVLTAYAEANRVEVGNVE